MPLSDTELKLTKLIERRRSALQEHLRALVAIPTGGNHTAGLDETRGRLCSHLTALGAKKQLIPGDPKPDWLYGVDPLLPALPTAICRRNAGAFDGRRNRREIFLAGHLDTVHSPTGPFNSLQVSADGRTATGPGCADMKGGLVIAIAALEALEEAGHRLDWTVLLNSDEETGSYHSERAIRDESARIAAAGGVGLAVEPAMANGGLVVERAGSGQFRIEVTGKAAHVGRDFASGVSAVNVLAQCILDAAELTDLSRGVIVNIGPIEGGQATNVVPDRALAWGNVRYQDERTAAELRVHLTSMVARRGGPASISVMTSLIRPAKPLTDQTRHLANLAAAVAGDLGQPLPFGKTSGVCDGNIMQSAGLPTIDTLGVRGGGLHTPDEWIDLTSLVERCQLLAVLMLRLGGGE